MIDLHSHTDQSDGDLSPAALVAAARAQGVDVLGITDHDTFAGYDQAVPIARDSGVELVCGIELSTRLNGHSVHLLGYFFHPESLAPFRAWIVEMQASRRERNFRLAARLRELGLDVTLEEAEARGRGMTGRPHFAQILLEKGYVSDLRQAFDLYLDESAPGYVHRHEPQFDESVRRIRDAGGIASLAHPVRVNGDVPALLPSLCAAGLNALEVYHTDHGPAEIALYLDLARRHDLLVTGGSDYHGPVKPGVRLGVGDGSLHVPCDVYDRLKAAAA